MKYYIIYCLILLMCCSACQNNNSPKLESQSLTSEAIKPFSDSLQADTFRLRLLGNEPKEMYFSFTITAFNGKKIYNIRIDAKDLFMNYDVKNIHKSKTQIQFLKDEVARFLDEENFLEPAVTSEEKPDANVPDAEFYEELKRTGLNGFSYRLGKERKIYIAWSQQAGSVKTYYNCCK